MTDEEIRQMTLKAIRKFAEDLKADLEWQLLRRQCIINPTQEEKCENC